MSSYENRRIFSQSGVLSQLTCGFSSEKDSVINEEQEYNSIHEAEVPCGQNETLSSKAESICEENRQINRYVELSLKQLEKKRIKLINKDKALDDERVKLLETKKRQSEHNLELQMSIENMSIKYANDLKQRDKVNEKRLQNESFIKLYEQNLAKGISIGEIIEESKQRFHTEFNQIKKKSKAIEDNIKEKKRFVVAKLEETAKKCKELKDGMMKDRDVMVGEIQTLAFQNDEILNKISRIEEDTVKSAHKNEALTQSHSAVVVELKKLNETIAKVHQALNEAKTVNASRIQHLKIQLNTEQNNRNILEAKLTEKESVMNDVATKLEESKKFANQLKCGVEEVQKNIDKKVKEIEQYEKKQSGLKEQENSLNKTLKKHGNVQSLNQCYKDKICTLEETIKLNINILSEKQNLVDKLFNQMKRLEEKLSDLKKNKSELETELKNLQTVANNLNLTVQENKRLFQLEKERKLKQNDSLNQRISELSSEIAVCALKLEELCHFNENAKEKESRIICLIEKCKETVKYNEEQFFKDEEEQIELVNHINQKMCDIKNQLGMYELFLIEAKPKQKELTSMLEKKEKIEQEIKLLNENHTKKLNTLENNHRTKLQGMDHEMEKHSSIMKNILAAEDESTEKLKEEIKEEEKIKIKHENEMRILHNKLKILKNKELMKRNEIVRMEKRQQKIIKTMEVTPKEIARVCAENVPEPVSYRQTRLMTPSSSASSQNILRKKINQTEEEKVFKPILPAPISKQEITRTWIASVPDDDYEFSEI